jgi:hypothetical protein
VGWWEENPLSSAPSAPPSAPTLGSGAAQRARHARYARHAVVEKVGAVLVWGYTVPCFPHTSTPVPSQLPYIPLPRSPSLTAPRSPLLSQEVRWGWRGERLRSFLRTRRRPALTQPNARSTGLAGNRSRRVERGHGSSCGCDGGSGVIKSRPAGGANISGGDGDCGGGVKVSS